AIGLFIIVLGHFDVFTYDEQGVQNQIATLSTGDCFGEMSLITGEPVSANVIAREPGSLLEIPKDNFQRLLSVVPPLGATLARILAQRLVRKICSNCKEEIVPSPEILSLYRGADLAPPERLFRGRGCLQCRGAGFRGRSAIGECLLIDEAVREAIHSRECSTPLVREAAKKQNFIPILVDGLETARAGETMVSEVLKVVVIE
ncbi:MAG: cyclic nucleotide-binding domain-containing protein, partial [Candidatus Hydrogenedentota bacterium]